MRGKEIIQEILYSAVEFHNENLEEKNSRYNSWQYCYSAFFKARENGNVDVDYLSLHLGFYLASWGMYRGSSFLLQKDYKIHTPIVGELLKTDYDVLHGIECDELENNLELLLNLEKNIKSLYDGNVSDTLVTKILMGTLGCCPAYDRYFLDTLCRLKREKICNIQQTFNKKSMLGIIRFYQNNFNKLEEFRKSNIIGGIMYPQMKVLDMAFWQYSFNKSKTSEN